MRKIALSILVVFFAFVKSQGANPISEIIVKKAEGITQVVLVASAPMDYKDFTLSGPERIVIDCKGANFALPLKTLEINRGGIKNIALSQFEREGGIARLVIELVTKTSYLVLAEENELTIALTTAETTPFEEWKASVAVGAPPVPPAPPPPPPETVVVALPPPPPLPPETVVVKPPPLPPETVVVKPPPLPPETVVVKPPPPPPETVVVALPPPPPVREIVAPPKPPVARPPVAPRERTVSLDLEDADLLTVLRAMADYAGKNIVAGSEVKGTVTVRLRNVTWTRAFEEILRATGFGYIEESGIIRVASPARLQSEQQEREAGQPLVSKIYQLEFTTASEIQGPLGKTLSSRGHIETDERTNALVVTDVASAHERVQDLINILDTRTPQVEIVARIVEVNTSSVRDLGIEWHLTNLASAPANVETKNIDMVPWGVTPPASAGTVVLGTLRSFAKLDATLLSLEYNNKAQTISNPRITSVNNKSAKIVGGKKIPISLRDVSGNTVTQMYTIGIVLQVTPHINSAENITLELHTEVSDIDPTAKILGGVVILTTEADTRVLLNNGETVVVGGLIKTLGGKTVQGVPILMHIPIIGELFKTTTRSRDERELLIFITPHILKQG
ncbi:MAG: AMIN domain-containing protein [Candidatus Edwardsbacteria bacterium]